MNQKWLFSIFSLGFVSLLVFALTFTTCKNATGPNSDPVDPNTNQTPVAKDFIFGNLTQTAGSVVPVSIRPRPGKSDGKITIYYNKSTTLPAAVGEYPVTFNVAKAAGWNAARGLSAGTLTINATDQDPAADDFEIGNLTQTAGSVTPVSIMPRAGKSDGTITIYYNGSTTLPTAAGDYTVTFDIAAATGFQAAIGLSAGTLTIENQTPVAEDYVFGNLTQTAGSVVQVSIVPKPGKSGGDVTAIYYNGSTTLPTETGPYLVTFDVAAVDGFDEATGLVAGTLTINATDQEPATDDFDFGNLTQTVGNVIAVSITPKTGKSAGTITVLYNGAATLPTAAGNYTVTFDVAAATGFKAAVGLSAGTLTINPAVASNVLYKIYSDGTLTSGYTITNWANANAFQLATTVGGGHSGTKAMRLPDNGQWASLGRGLTIKRTGTPAIDWSTVGALSFWVKGDNVSVNAFGFLDDNGSGEDPLNVEYKGEDGLGIMLTNTWQNILIPLPASRAKNAAVSKTEVFKIWLEGAAQNGKAVYIDDIELVSAPKSFAIVIPGTKSLSAGTVSIASLLGNYKAIYTVGGKTVSLLNKTAPTDDNGTIILANWFDITYNVSSGATRNGDNLNVTGNFTLSVTFGGNTSNTLSATVTQPQPSNQTPVAGDYNISGLSQTYDGSAKSVTITPKSGKSSGARTILYNGSTTAPSAAGNYTVTFNVAAAAGWNAATGLSAGTLIIQSPPVAGTTRFPFPQWESSLATYTVKPMQPTNKTRAQQTTMMINLLKDILNNNLIFDSRSPLNANQFRVLFEHHTTYPMGETQYPNVKEQHITTSESHGYGMLILALTAGCEEALTAAGHTWKYGATSIKHYYDGMLRTAMGFKSPTSSHPSGSFQMSWELFGYNTGTNDTGFSVNDNTNVRQRGFRYSANSNTSAKIAPFANSPGGSSTGGGGNTGYNNNGTTSATDGDMDIMYSLILADKQWGSSGEFNYRQIALDMLRAFNGTHGGSLVNPTYKFLKIGDWANNTVTSGYGRGSRPSDFILTHLKAYKAFDTSRDWQSAIDATYDIIRVIREGQAAEGRPNNGLLPDFVVRTGTTAIGASGYYWEPAPAGFLEGNDNTYNWNSCRVPWRLGTDVLLYGNTTIGSKSLVEYVLNPMNTLARAAVGNSPAANLSGLGTQKQLTASSFSGNTNSGFASPFLVTAAALSPAGASGSDQTWINALWNYSNLANHENNFYADYYKLICMITASGNYWRPDLMN